MRRGSSRLVAQFFSFVESEKSTLSSSKLLSLLSDMNQVVSLAGVPTRAVVTLRSVALSAEAPYSFRLGLQHVSIAEVRELMYNLSLYSPDPLHRRPTVTAAACGPAALGYAGTT